MGPWMNCVIFWGLSFPLFKMVVIWVDVLRVKGDRFVLGPTGMHQE
jgi:hypothetical protein